MTGITLSCLNISMVQFQLVGCTAMPICYNKDKSGTPLKLKENRTCPYSFSNQIPGKIRPLRLRSERRCYVRDKAKFSKPEARTYWHRKQNTAVQRSSHLLCTCAGEPTTYTMDSVHTAGPVYPFSGKYARKILRLDGSILCLLQTPCRSLYLHGVLFSHERKERHSEENL